MEPAWTGSGIVHKGRVKGRPQEAAVHLTHPSTRLEVRLPRSKEKCVALGRYLLGTLVSGPEGLVQNQHGLWSWVCLATLREHSSHSPGSWGDGHKGFPKAP